MRTDACRIMCSRKAIIVCAHPEGGHIEHAYDLARGVGDNGFDVRLISRRGAAEYVHAAGLPTGIVEETLSLGRRLDGQLQRTAARRAFRAIVEQMLVIAAYLRCGRPSVVIFEEPKFLLPRPIRARRTRALYVLHNPVE